MTSKTSVNELVSQLAYLTTKPQFAKPAAAEVDHVQATTASKTEPAKNVSPPSPFAKQSLTNACSANAGARVLFATDEWFATADNLLQDGPPLFVADLYCEQGKVMDGWESRRRREAGHDWCLIKLSSRQSIVGVEIDTAHFTGNQTPLISLQVADLTYPQQEASMVTGLPGVLERLLNNGRGVQGTGHHPEEVQQAERACSQVEWSELLPMTSLQPGSENTRMHYFTLPVSVMGTHVRVNYYPDGGVARLRLWSSPMEDETESSSSKPLYSPIQTGKICTVVSHSSTDSPPSRKPYEFKELSAAKNGGVGLAVSNKHYGEPWHLIQETLGKDMGDGWETARHPDRPAIWVRDPNTNLLDSPLMDWAVLKLGSMASEGVARIILDTRHFKGNYPESVLVEGCFAERGITDDMVCSTDESSESVKWFPLLPRTRMAPNSEHVFERNLNQITNAARAVTHVRVSIYPDGGISRVRVYGNDSRQQDDEEGMRSHL